MGVTRLGWDVTVVTLPQVGGLNIAMTYVDWYVRYL